VPCHGRSPRSSSRRSSRCSRQGAVDLAYADPEATGFATNVVVIRETPEGDLDLDDVTAQFVGRVEDTLATDAGVGAVEDRELDGVPAKTYAFRSRQDENGPLRQRQVVAVEDDAIYTITWSMAADAFEEQEATLDRVAEDAPSWPEAAKDPRPMLRRMVGGVAPGRSLANL
jgi:hypothetical protein